MKLINDSNNGRNNNNDNDSNSLLGFSLSPHMKMELTSHHEEGGAPFSSTALSNTFCIPPSSSSNSSSHINFSSPFYNSVVGPHAASFLHSPLSFMPLNSDGSLSIMDALTTSSSPMPTQNPSPKLEDFLGGSMALSLDSTLYFNPNGESENDNSREHSLNLLQQPQRNLHLHHHHQHNQQQHPFQYFPAIYYQPPMQHEEEGKETQIQNCATEDGWVTMEQQNMVGSSSMVVDDNGGGSGPMGCEDLHALSLSMSPGSQSSCVTVPRQVYTTGSECVVAMETKKRGLPKVGQKQTVHRKSIDTFGQRTSQYRGVTRHRWTGRYEAHLWDNSCKKEGQTRKGRQVYLGGYDTEEKAARAYDLAALKYWGPATHINFPVENYRAELEEMEKMNRLEYVAHLRRRSSGFSRGASIYRGVTRHHQHGRWQARIGRVAGNKDLYLGTFSTQEEAAEAYDIAAIKFRGANAVTNFDVSRYDVDQIISSNTLLVGELARRPKGIEPNNSQDMGNISGNGSDWKMVLQNSPQQQPHISSFNVECLDPKSTSSGFYLAGIDSVSHQPLVDERATYLSNASSLASSREVSPDKSGHGPSTYVSKPALASSSTSGVSSWFPSVVAPLRPSGPAISVAHYPFFAAWNE